MLSLLSWYANRYAERMSEQIAVRIPDELAAAIDALVASGRFPTKANAVRAAVAALVESERRRELGERIAEGYRRAPQDDDEVNAARNAAIRSIHGEPW
jgi:Arc/MetJ-type ribon-helix-helix transcriptional regulator